MAPLVAILALLNIPLFLWLLKRYVPSKGSAWLTVLYVSTLHLDNYIDMDIPKDSRAERLAGRLLGLYFFAVLIEFTIILTVFEDYIT